MLHPDGELKKFLSIAQEHSRRSCSTVRKDFVCSDGILVASSHDGSPVEYTIQPPIQKLPGE